MRDKIVLVNFSNIQKGGALQVASSFIESSLLAVNNGFPVNFYFVFSKACYNYLENCKVPLEGLNFIIIEESVASYRTRREAVRKLSAYEELVNPYSVFTLFGPSYWKPKSKNHLMGYAIPHYIFPESPYFNLISFKENIKHLIRKIYKLHYFKHDASSYVVESEVVKDRIVALLRVPSDKVIVANNTFHQVFDNRLLWQSNDLPDKPDNEVWLLMIGANYLHKNVQILKKVIPLLKRSARFEFKFLLTISREEFIKVFTSDLAVLNSIIFLGSRTVYQCPELYYKSDILFFPTLLECFSASYAEAMKMDVPILTSDLMFSKSICQDAAIYVDPLDEGSLVKSIIQIIEDESLRGALIERGKEVLKKFDNAEDRFNKVVTFITNQSL